MKVIDYQTSVAWRCPNCGLLDINKINIFDFSGHHKFEIKCACNSSKVTIGKKDNNSYWLEYFCFLCKDKHLQVFSKNEFWSPGLKKVKCAAHEVELGYIGTHSEVKELLIEEEEYLEEAREKLKIDNYFENPSTDNITEPELEKKSLRKLKKIKILEGVVKALQKPPLER